MVRTTPAVIRFLIGALVAVQMPVLLRAQAPPLDIRWRGRVDQVVRLPSDHGEISHTFGVNVVWKERRVDVVAGGRTVGQVIVLEDDGSAWTGASKGLIKSDVTTTTVSGTNSGTGQPITAWVYRSAVTDDPVRDLDGAYGFASAGSGASIPTTIVMTTTFAPPTTTRVTTGVQFHAGGGVMYPTTYQNQMTADELRRVVTEGRALAANVAAIDRAPRSLNGGAMVGAYTYTHPPGGMVITMSWNIHRRLSLTGTLTDTDAEWRPMAIGGPTTAFTAAVDPALGIKGRFRFTLFGVSRQPGYAMNKGTGTGLDLRFSDDQPIAVGDRTETADGWTIETSEALSSATIHVTAYDPGAWGRLKAEIEVEGEWYDCLPNGATSVGLPADRNNNHIADVWERDTGLSRVEATGDVDSGPAGASVGDGFSNYEEYRGFYVGGEWTSTDPTWKELFIRDVNSLGTGDFASSQIVPLVIDEDEWQDGTRIVNYNRDYASAGAQRGLRLVNAALDPGILGIVEPRVGTPNQVTVVKVDKAQNDRRDSAALDSTIAHELGHAVGVNHHGHWELNTCGSGSEQRIIALWRGAHAGDQQCVMAYSGAAFFKRADRVCREYTWDEVWGASFCRSPLGTGINAGPEAVSGDASRGNCFGQLRLK